MKIGIDARLWNETGVGRYIRNLVQELQDLDKKNQYILFVFSKDRDKIQSSIVNTNWSITSVDIRWHTLKEQLQFGKILKNENLDLMHFPYFSVPILYNRSFVVTIHDLILHHFPTGKATTLPLPIYYLKQFGYRYVIEHAAKKAKKILTVSETTKHQIVNDLHIPKEKIIVTYEGVDSGFSVQNTTNKKENYFLYVGNAYPHKNLEKLLYGFKEFKKDDKENAQLIFVGKEDYFYKRLKEKVIKDGLTEYTVFKNFVSDEELINLYQNAQALILPSLMEGFGLPGLEAMQNSCLVACSEIASFKEIYTDAGIYFNPKSIVDIAKTLKTIYSMSEKEKDKYIQKGKKRIENFSWTKMAAQTLEVYESCIGL